MIRASLLIALVTAACAAPASELRVVVAGDSVLAWNDGGVAGELRRVTQARVTDVSVNGGWVGFPELGGPLMRFGIAGRVPEDRFDWVVMNGGANDLGVLCGCRNCNAVRDRLISRDGKTGALPSVWAELHERTGAKVLILGYYDGIFRGSGCLDALRAIDARAARFAAATEWAEFTDADRVVTSGMLDIDRIHPAPEGSKAIARLIAEKIAP